MSNFLNCCSSFLFYCQSHWRTPRPPTNHVFKCDVMSSCLAKSKNKFVCASQIWKHIHWAFRYMNRRNTYWTPPACLWVHVNANEWVGTAPEHPLSVHKCHWVRVNTHWGSMNTTESLLNVTHHGVATRKLSFVSELNTPSMLVSAHEYLWVSIEHTLNACECTWTPLSQYWTHPECLWVCVNTFEWALNAPWMHVSAYECLWVSGNIPWPPIECAWLPLWLTMVWPWESSHQNWTLPECLWVHMNAFESVLNTPWMLVSAHECLWVSIEHTLNACECTWTPLSEY